MQTDFQEKAGIVKVEQDTRRLEGLDRTCTLEDIQLKLERNASVADKRNLSNLFKKLQTYYVKEDELDIIPEYRRRGGINISSEFLMKTLEEVADDIKFISNDGTLFAFCREYLNIHTPYVNVELLSKIFDLAGIEYEAYCPGFKKEPPLGIAIGAKMHINAISYIVANDIVREPDSFRRSLNKRLLTSIIRENKREVIYASKSNNFKNKTPVSRISNLFSLREFVVKRYSDEDRKIVVGSKLYLNSLFTEGDLDPVFILEP